MYRLFFCNRGKTGGYYADSVLFFPSSVPYNRSKEEEEEDTMTARERILALRLLEKQERQPVYAAGIGIRVEMVKKDSGKKEEKHV